MTITTKGTNERSKLGEKANKNGLFIIWFGIYIAVHLLVVWLVGLTELGDMGDC